MSSTAKSNCAKNNAKAKTWKQQSGGVGPAGAERCLRAGFDKHTATNEAVVDFCFFITSLLQSKLRSGKTRIIRRKA